MSYNQMRLFVVWAFVGLCCGALVMAVPGCSSTCASSADCAPGLLCIATAGSAEKSCQARPDGVNNEERPPTPDFKDSGTDTVTPPDQRVEPDNTPPVDTPPVDTPPGETTPDTPTPSGKAPVKGDLVINEIHADPKSVTGDANGDGTVSSSHDEFIEIVNTTDQALDLGGVVVVKDTPLYTFAVGTTLPAKTAVVIFGGGLAGDADINTGKPHPTKFGGALVYTKSLSLTNSGKNIVLQDKDAGELDTFGYGSAGTDCPGDKDQSVTKWPDLTGPCTLHTTAAGDPALLWSPGTRVGGGKFSDAPPPKEPTTEGTTEVTPEVTTEVTPDAGGEVTPDVIAETPPTETTPDTPTGPTPTAGDLVLNELHTDPDATNGDANGDGNVSSSEDEFIEIVNVSGKALQVGGVEFHFKGASRYTLKPLLLPDKGVIVIFDGGLAGDTDVNSGKPHTTKFGGAYVYTGGIGSLNNTGAQIAELKTAAGVLISKFEYGSTTCKGDQNQSLTLNPDLTGTCALHSTVQATVLFSPGTKADGTKF